MASGLADLDRAMVGATGVTVTALGLGFMSATIVGVLGVTAIVLAVVVVVEAIPIVGALIATDTTSGRILALAL